MIKTKNVFKNINYSEETLSITKDVNIKKVFKVNQHLKVKQVPFLWKLKINIVFKRDGLEGYWTDKNEKKFQK